MPVISDETPGPMVADQLAFLRGMSHSLKDIQTLSF